MPVQITQRERDPFQEFVMTESNSVPDRKTLQFRARRDSEGANLDAVLSSALVASDKEFGQVLHEIGEISKALRADKPDVEALRVAVHPAVWCAVKHVLLERELRQLALSDDLTCLYNRRGFFAAAAQQLKVARRNQKAALLLFCDVDGLKAINDTYGHREGDLALVRTADALEEAFRDSDVLARLGGDEFAVLATDVAPRDQQAILNRLHKSLEKAGKVDPRYKLSLSVGAAWYRHQHPVSLGDLMQQADEAMYQHKRSRFALLEDRSLPFGKPFAPGGKPDVVRGKV